VGFPAVLAAAGTDISHPLCYFLGGRAACVDEFLATSVAIRPLLTSALAKKIPVVSPEFFEAESRGVRELQLRLLRGTASGTSLDNVLGATASGLNHLVVGPATSIDVALAETNRHIEAELRDLEAFQLPIPAMWRDEIIAVWRLSGRSAHAEKNRS
jgi:hypothetical protein